MIKEDPKILVLRSRLIGNDDRNYQKMRQTIWLYLYLVLQLNPRTGRLVTKVSTISQDMGIKEETIRSWLGHLRRKGYVWVKRQGDYLMISVTGLKPIPESPQAKVLKPGEVVNGEQQRLAQRIAKEFEDEGNLGYYEDLCERYPEHLINRAFSEVQRVPQSKIKKSRGALFTYLLKKYADKKKEQKENPLH